MQVARSNTFLRGFERVALLVGLPDQSIHLLSLRVVGVVNLDLVEDLEELSVGCLLEFSQSLTDVPEHLAFVIGRVVDSFDCVHRELLDESAQ